MHSSDSRAYQRPHSNYTSNIRCSRITLSHHNSCLCYCALLSGPMRMLLIVICTLQIVPTKNHLTYTGCTSATLRMHLKLIGAEEQPYQCIYRSFVRSFGTCGLCKCGSNYWMHRRLLHLYWPGWCVKSVRLRLDVARRWCIRPILICLRSDAEKRGKHSIG